MGNFAENLNLGNRVLPPLQIKNIESALYLKSGSMPLMRVTLILYGRIWGTTAHACALNMGPKVIYVSLPGDPENQVVLVIQEPP